MEKKEQASSTQKKEAKKSERKARYTYVIGIIIAILVLLGVATYYLQHSGKTSDFTNFKSAFNTAPRVAIYATAYNGTAVSATIGCATSIIEVITGSPQIHRNSTTIDFFAINQTTCVYENGIGGEVGNLTYNSISNCIAVSKTEPSIFLNYSTTNTTVITPGALYVSGDANFLAECGIASELD